MVENWPFGAFDEIREDRPPLEGGHHETKHYSSILLLGTSGQIHVEVIALRRGLERQLNGSFVLRVCTGGNTFEWALFVQSYLLLDFETQIKNGKTAKQVLIDARRSLLELADSA